MLHTLALAEPKYCNISDPVYWVLGNMYHCVIFSSSASAHKTFGTIIWRQVFFEFPTVCLQAFFQPFYICIYLYGRNRNDILCIHTNRLYQDQTALNWIHNVCYRDVKKENADQEVHVSEKTVICTQTILLQTGFQVPAAGNTVVR